MARRRPKEAAREENAAAYPTEGDAVGLETLETQNRRVAPQDRADQADDWTSSDRSTEESDEEVARRAYERYQQRGGEHGHDQDDWFEAEREVRSSRTRNE